MNLALKILLLTDGLFLLAAATLGPIYAIFVEEIGGDILTAGTSFALFSLVLGILILILGKIQDVVLRETELWIAAGYFISAIGFFSYLFVKVPWQLFVVQIILGIGEAIHTPAYSAVYSRHLDSKQYAFQWGAWDAIRNFTTAIGAVVGAFLATLFGFQILFVMMGTLTLLGSIVIFLTPRKIL